MRSAIGAALVGLCLLGGCSQTKDFFKTDRTRLLSPDKVIDRRSTGAPINPIYSSVGPTDTAQELVPNATFPTEGDWTYEDSDYIIGPTDVINVSILDLYQEGLETILQRQVSSSGYIDLPLLSDRIRAEGLTAEQLKEAVVSAYRPDILKNPIVSITLTLQRQSTFSIVGAIARPQPYNILRKDMRLLEAISMAGGVTQTNIRYVYVIRPTPAVRRSKEPTQIEALPELPPEAPAEESAPATPEAAQPQETPINVEDALRILGGAVPGPAPQPEAEPQPDESVMPSFAEISNVGAQAADAPPADSNAPRWVYRDGQWVRIEPGAQQQAAGPAAGPGPQTPAQTQEGPGQADDPFGWRRLDQSAAARIIAINLPELEAGNQRMNIIVRDHDIVVVPNLQVGEFYIMGEVARPGPYSLTGRRVTLKMAVAAAGNLGPLAWPENTILIRRVGQDQEQIFPLDLEAIFRGEQPDIFLKPNDVVAVGTNVKASFYAVVRNAFRLTYGFGFIWDRNFADPLDPITLDGRRFTRW